MTKTLEIIQPDDWHLHLRDGSALKTTVPATAGIFARAIVMPNLTPPVTNCGLALNYRERLLAAVPEGLKFDPLMTLYLTDTTKPEDIELAHGNKNILGCKLYPAGATTNSNSGVTDLSKLTPVLQTMSDKKLPLLVHGEVVDSDIDIFDREKVFIDKVLIPLTEQFPQLKIVLEHITTEQAVLFVQQAPENVAATITAHHLLLNRNHLLTGGIRPHNYCLPVLKRLRHQQALGDAVASGSAKFFLGTDSAPHSKQDKESGCGCAGCYTAPYALPLYAEAFERLGALDKLEAFTSIQGPKFYNLPINSRKVRLIKKPSAIPDCLPFADTTVVPFQAGESVTWQAELI